MVEGTTTSLPCRPLAVVVDLLIPTPVRDRATAAMAQEVTLNPRDMDRMAVLATTQVHPVEMSTAVVVATHRTTTGVGPPMGETIMARPAEDTTRVEAAGEEEHHRRLMATVDRMAIRIKAEDGEEEGIINLDARILCTADIIYARKTD